MDIELLYWGRPSEFFPTLFQLNEQESFLDIKIITQSISPYGVHPMTVAVHVKRQDSPEIYIGTLELDYLVRHGAITKDFLDLAWCIDRAKSEQAGLPITINPALIFQAPTPPVSGDEESDEEVGIYLRRASPLKRKVTPPPVAADKPSENEILEISSDAEVEYGEIEEEENSVEPQVTLGDEMESGQECETEASPDEYEENEGEDIHDHESEASEASPDDKEEDINAQIASLEFLISELRKERRERQNLQLALKQLDELQAKKDSTKQRKLDMPPSNFELARIGGKSPELVRQMSPYAHVPSVLMTPTTPSTPSTPQGNKRKADNDTPPFSSPSKRVKTQETRGFGANRHLSPHTPPRDLEYSEDEDSDEDEQTVNYSNDDDEDSEDNENSDDEDDDGNFGSTRGKSLLPPYDDDDDDDDSEVDEDEELTSLPPVRPQRAGAFSTAEHNALHALITSLRANEASSGLQERDRLKDTKLYARLSSNMRALGYHRTPGSCKNYWNRYGRALSGYDERIGTIKNTSLVTSAQN